MKREQGILSLFQKEKPIIGMIHLKGDNDKEVFERAKKEIQIYLDNGIDGIMLENYYGGFLQLEAVLKYAADGNISVPYGVNCLNVDAMGFELAKNYGAKFLQIDSVVGHVKPRDESSLEAFFQLYRKDCPAYLIGGVRFKYQPVLSEKTVEEDIQTAMARCDAIAVTQSATGEETSMEKIRQFREVMGSFPLIIAAGVTCENAAAQLAIGDGAIVGSYFKDNFKDFGEVCPEHVRKLMNEVEKIREGK